MTVFLDFWMLKTMKKLDAHGYSNQHTLISFPISAISKYNVIRRPHNPVLLLPSLPHLGLILHSSLS
jgi:hypothetical protein